MKTMLHAFKTNINAKFYFVQCLNNCLRSSAVHMAKEQSITLHKCT